MDSFELPDPVPVGLWPLVPKNPTDMHVLFALIREELQRSIVGHEQIVAQLALVGATHIAQDVLPSKPLSRALLIGETGTGRTSLALQLASVLGLPWVHIPATSTAETNWKGTDVADLIGSMYQEVFRSHSPADTAELAERAVVIIDDIDHLRLPGRYTSSPQTYDYQAGRQRSLLPVVGDGVVPVEVGSQHISWPSRRALVISTGTFVGVEADPLGLEHLADWGMIPELARMLCRGRVLRVPQLTDRQAHLLIRRQAQSLTESFSLFGYRLRVSSEAVTYATGHIRHSGSPDLGAVFAWLTDAAHRVLLKLIGDGTPPGTTYVLAPDDLDPPGPSSGTWRE